MFDSFSHNCLAFGLPNYCRCPPHESAAGELWQGRRGPSHPALLCSCCGIRVNRLYRGKCWINFGILCSHGAVDLPSHQAEKQSHDNLGENVEQVICKGKRIGVEESLFSGFVDIPGAVQRQVVLLPEWVWTWKFLFIQSPCFVKQEN